MKYSILLFIFAFGLNSQHLTAQCDCMGGAPIGGASSLSADNNGGLLSKNQLSISSFLKYGAGDKYFYKDTRVSNGLVKDYSFSFLGFSAGYGLSNDLTLGIESGYFINKEQDFYLYKLKSSGFSQIVTNIKYNLIDDIEDNIGFNIGAGIKIPLNTEKNDLPQHILPSNGAYGVLLYTQLRHSFMNEALNLSLINTFEYNNENKNKYQYGSSLYSSLIFGAYLFENTVFALELRNEFRAKDSYDSQINNNSGDDICLIVPHVTRQFGDFSLSALFDYPFYKYYNGKQLSNDYSFGISVNWQPHIFN